MPAPYGPPWTRGSASRRGASYVNPDLRVSDAERAEVADRLSKHYGDGRLDQAEFSKRLDQAMSATTQSDLSGLFADLPDTGEPDPELQRRPRHRVLVLALVIVVTAIVGRALMTPVISLLWIALLVFLLWRYGPLRHHRPS
jgi:hypothetical protein